MFSTRAEWRQPLNRLTQAKQARRARGEAILDLTESNPTKVGLDYPLDELAAAFAAAARASYEPDPRGLRSAREALAISLACSPDDLVLTASTSEAYAYLFKLLMNPGDEIATAAPTYPLLDHLAAFESLNLKHFPLEREGSHWALHIPELERIVTEKTRAVVVVHPNHPVGSYLTESEQGALTAFCSERRIALISDEVFFDDAIDAPHRAGPAASRDEGLVVSLGGLSKSAGLPHYKLGWIRVGGAAEAKRDALEALELIADSYLSVSTPVQAALPRLLEIAPAIRGQIAARVRRNLDALRAAVAPDKSLQLLPVEGGWSAVLRIPRVASDEQVALRLLDESGVLIHPGYFFDFASDGYLVVSLLPAPETFDAGIAKIARFSADFWR